MLTNSGSVIMLRSSGTVRKEFGDPEIVRNFKNSEIDGKLKKSATIGKTEKSQRWQNILRLQNSVAGNIQKYLDYMGDQIYFTARQFLETNQHRQNIVNVPLGQLAGRLPTKLNCLRWTHDKMKRVIIFSARHFL